MVIVYFFDYDRVKPIGKFLSNLMIGLAQIKMRMHDDMAKLKLGIKKPKLKLGLVLFTIDRDETRSAIFNLHQQIKIFNPLFCVINITGEDKFIDIILRQ